MSFWPFGKLRVNSAKNLASTSVFGIKGGVNRRHYYDVRKVIEEKGPLEKSRRAPRIGNRVFAEVEQTLLDYSLHFPPLTGYTEAFP